MKPPKEGSNKRQVWDAFQKAKGGEKGRAVAFPLGKKLGLQEGTVKSWCNEWDRANGITPPSSGRKPPPPRAKGETSNPPIKREKLTASPPADDAYPFKYTSQDAAERALLGKAKASGLRPWAFHLLEENGKFAIAPAHHKAKGPIPQFKKGDIVFDAFIKNSRARVVEAGPEQTEIKYLNPAVKGPTQACVINRYLVRLQDMDELPDGEDIRTSSSHTLKASELKIRKTKSAKAETAKRERL